RSSHCRTKQPSGMMKPRNESQSLAMSRIASRVSLSTPKSFNRDSLSSPVSPLVKNTASTYAFANV
ncbi:hypothetical protein KXW37_003906, partial [Aspergillus fumigatus]